MSDERQITRKEFVGGAAALGMGAALSGFAGSARAMTAPALAKKRPILLGLAATATGTTLVADSQDHVQGTTLAVEEINAAGGVLGRKIEIATTDFDEFDPQKTQVAFQRLVAKHPDAITTAFAPIVEVPANITAAYGCPYINGDTAGVGEDLVKKDRSRYSNRFSDAAEYWYGLFFPRFLDAVQKRGWKPSGNTVHLIDVNIRYSQVIAETAQKAIAATNGRWKAVALDTAPFPTLDWGPTIAKLHSTNAAVIFISHFDAAEEAAFCKQFAANPVKDALVYLQYAPSQSEFLRIAGSDANGFVWSSVLAVPPTPGGKAFLAKFRKRFNRTNVGIAYTAFGYDTTQILARAWRKVGDTRNFKAVNNYIRLHAYRGVLGTYDFSTKGQTTRLYPDQVANPKLGIPHMYFQIQNGRHRAIAPEPFVETRYVAPPWASQ
jgi:branched-chain amino acid transport system substrate-binding protein